VFTMGPNRFILGDVRAELWHGSIVRPRRTPLVKPIKVVHSFSTEEELMDQGLVQFRRAAARENRGRRGPQRPSRASTSYTAKPSATTVPA
jgi:hypothetical protein